MNLNKIILITLVLFILNAAMSLAAWDEINNAWHEYNDDFTIDDVLYQITLNQYSQDKLMIKVDNENKVIDLGECEIMGDYQYCFDDTDMGSEKATITPSGIAVPAVKLIIYENTIKDNEIKITYDYTVEAKDLEEIPIQLIVENQADDWIKNVKYRITIPENVKVINQYDFKWDGSRTLMLNFALSPKETRKFSLKVLPQTFENHVFEYTAEYDAITEQKTISKNFNIDLSAPFKLTDKLSSSNIGMDSTLYYTLSIENKNPNERLKINKFSIQGPYDFDYVPVKGLSFNKVANFKSRTSSVRGGDTVEYKLAITPKSDGNKNMTLKYEFEIKGETFEQTIVRNFKVEEKGLKASMQLNKDAVIPGEDLELTLVLENTNDNLEYRDLVFDLKSELFDQTITLDSLEVNSEKRISLQKFVSPMIEDDKKYTFTGVLKYKGKSDYEFSKEISKNLEVTGSGELIKLIQDVNPKRNVKPGDEILVTVSLENLKDQTFEKINLFEQYPRQIDLVSGATTRTMDLANNEKKEAYIYKLMVPKLYKQDEFNITSTAVLSQIGYNKEVTTTVTVDVPEDIFVDDEKQGKEEKKDDTPVVTVNKKEDKEEDKGFFGNLIDSIDGFFSGLFGG